MAMLHPIQCSCGNLEGTLNLSGPFNRCVCYCPDCQAFARFLGRDGEILDRSGGTGIVQVNQGQITFTRGSDNLACMRLTDKGLLRWYAACCNTPVGNTPPNSKLSIVGLVHNCLRQGNRPLDEAFGPIRVHVYTRCARGEPKPKSTGLVAAMPRLLALAIGPRLDRSYKRSPFFEPQSGSPVAEPKVLNDKELHNLKHSA